MVGQKFPVNNFEWIEDTSQFYEDFIKNYLKESNEWYFPQVDVQYLEKLRELQNNLPFLPERTKIKNVEKLVADLHDKTEYVTNVRNLKQVLNHGLILKTFHRVIKFNQKACPRYWYEHRSKKKKK